VNVCNEGGSIIPFSDTSPFGKEQQSHDGGPVDGDWLDYCRARERRERAAAKNAGTSQARRVHQELAMAYARLIRRATAP